MTRLDITSCPLSVAVWWCRLRLAAPRAGNSEGEEGNRGGGEDWIGLSVVVWRCLRRLAALTGSERSRLVVPSPFGCAEGF